jgi:PhnB protein
MARVSTYLNFMGNTFEAFEFYRGVFGTEYLAPPTRFRDMPGGAPPLPEHELDMILHIELPILGGHVLMATEMLASAGHTLERGNNVSINLEPDSRAEADDIYSRLSVGSLDATGMAEMPWGAYWCSFIDRFGIRWMINAPVN